MKATLDGGTATEPDLYVEEFIPTSRYSVNILLLALASAAGAIYVRRHYAPSWSGQWAAIVGGGMSLWTFVEMINSLILKPIGKGGTALFTKWMRARLLERYVTYVLAGTLASILMALAVTSSVFLYCEDTKSIDSFEVQITPTAFPYEKLVIDGTHRIAGGRMYFAAATNLRAKTVRPYRQCTAETISFHSWSAVKFGGPTSLPCFQYRIVRLVPVGSLWDVLPPLQGNTLKRYYCQIKIGGHFYPSSPLLLHQQIVEIGARTEELPEQFDDDARNEIRKVYADVTPGISQDQLTDNVNNATAAAPLRIGTPALNGGTVLIYIYDRVEGNTPIVAAISASISGRTMTSTVPIDWKSP
jgi:hypothetical protein